MQPSFLAPGGGLGFPQSRRRSPPDPARTGASESALGGCGGYQAVTRLERCSNSAAFRVTSDCGLAAHGVGSCPATEAKVSSRIFFLLLDGLLGRALCP